MSKLGKKPILIPKDTQVKIDSGKLVISGPKGSKQLSINDKIFSATISKDNNLILKLINKNEKSNVLWGTTRSIVNSTIIGDFYSEMHLVGGCLIFTGFLIWFSKDYSSTMQIDNFPIKNGFIVGFFQGLAILPGISRSGSTIAISKILGMDPVRAARFSFLLFIPAIIGATLLKIQDIDETISDVGILSLILGFFSSVITSYFSINLLLTLIKKQQFHYFTPYCLVLGTFLIYTSLF